VSHVAWKCKAQRREVRGRQAFPLNDDTVAAGQDSITIIRRSIKKSKLKDKQASSRIIYCPWRERIFLGSRAEQTD